MDKQSIQQLQQRLDAVVQTVPDENIEFWFARDLLEPLGYARWENFLTTIQCVVISCETKGCDPKDHFRSVTKMVGLGSGAKRETGKVGRKAGCPKHARNSRQMTIAVND